jgi:hypothetical protein
MIVTFNIFKGHAMSNGSYGQLSKKPDAPKRNNQPTSAPRQPIDQLAQQVQTNPDTLHPRDMIQLQATIGNRATQQVIQRRGGGRGDDKGKEKSKGKEKDKGSPTGIMPYKEFRKQTGQEEKKSFFGRDKTRGFGAAEMQAILSGATGVDQLKEQRTANNLTNEQFDDPNHSSVLHRNQLDINTAYGNYENDPSLSNLIRLNDAITFWKTMFSGMSFVAPLVGVLDEVLGQIQERVKQQTIELAGDDADAINAASNVLKDTPNSASKADADSMPDFLKEVGVPEGYYHKYIENDPLYLGDLYTYYKNLQEGRHSLAGRGFQTLQHKEGIAFIKSLFMAHFPEQSNLAGLAGTTTNEGEGLTDLEKAAILMYSGHDYVAMNNQLREQQNRRAGMNIGRRVERRPQGPATKEGKLPEVTPEIEAQKTAQLNQDRQKDQADFSRDATMKLAVSGLNKLPKFQGMAYRQLKNLDLTLMKPGATFADLAFMSASPSMTGVFNYAGAATLYQMIHAKTPANIVALAGSAKEGEVLFRPGTKFQILAIWQTVGFRVPPGAPPEAQLMMHQSIPSGKMSKKQIVVIEMAEV